MFENLLKKQYYFKVKTSKRIFILEYHQATIKELFEFLYKSSKKEFNLFEYIFDFIEKKWYYINIFWFKIKKFKLKESEKQEIQLEILKIFEIIKNTRFKWFFKDKKTSWGNKSPFSSLLALISDKFSCDPNYVLENYTWEQLFSEDWYIDWIIWNNNELSKEWKIRNDRKAKIKENKNRSFDEDLKIAQELENRIKSKK